MALSRNAGVIGFLRWRSLRRRNRTLNCYYIGCMVKVLETVDHPDLSGQGDHVGSRSDELERRRPIERAAHRGESTVRIGSHERPRIGYRRRSFRIARTLPLRQSVETPAGAYFHIHQKGGAGRYGSDCRRFDLEAQHLPVLRLVGNWAGLAHEYRITLHRQPGRYDVAECMQHSDRAVKGDLEHTVEMRFGDDESVV